METSQSYLLFEITDRNETPIAIIQSSRLKMPECFHKRKSKDLLIEEQKVCLEGSKKFYNNLAEFLKISKRLFNRSSKVLLIKERFFSLMGGKISLLIDGSERSLIEELEDFSIEEPKLFSKRIRRSFYRRLEGLSIYIFTKT